MRLYDLMGLISTIALWIPILLLVVYKLAWYRSFPALLGYLAILCTHNLLLIEFLAPSAAMIRIAEAAFYFLAAPLTLLFLTYFCRTAAMRKKIHITVLAILIFQVLVGGLYGFNDKAFSFLSIPGLGISLIAGLLFFARQVKMTIVFQKGIGKAFLVSAVLFASIGITYIYLVRYYTNPDNRYDAQLILFMVCLLLGVGLTVGLIFEQKRVKELEELRIAREELKEIYGDGHEEKTTGPFGTVALHFDNNESWN